MIVRVNAHLICTHFLCFQQMMQFDGVFFQKHMEQMTRLDADHRKRLLSSIQKYRIYASI